MATRKKSDAAGGVQAVGFAPLPSEQRDGGRNNLDLLLDVNVEVSAEVGSATVTLQDVLDLVPGSVLRLDKRADEAIDLRVNGKLVARGEVVMVDDCYGLRITKIVGSEERLESLR